MSADLDRDAGDESCTDVPLPLTLGESCTDVSLPLPPDEYMDLSLLGSVGRLDPADVML